MSKVVVIINASNNGSSGNICCKMESTIPTLKDLLLSNGYNVVLYDTKTILTTFNYKGGIYPSVIGSLHWLPFIFVTDDQTWTDIQNGIDRRFDINVMNGKFNGSIFLNMRMYSGVDEIKNYYIEPTDSNAVLEWVSQF